MASLCVCGKGNCEGDDGVTTCFNFLRQQYEENLRLAEATFHAHHAYARAQVQFQVQQAQANLAQAQAHNAQVQAQAHAQAQRDHAQAQYAAFQAREEQEKVARAMIKMSGVNDVSCHLCAKICNGPQGLKAHMRCHYNTFRCNACHFAVANNTAATRHAYTCSRFDLQLARTHFETEAARVMHKH